MVFFSISDAYGDFTIEPKIVKINVAEQSAIINFNNGNEVRKFVLEIKDANSSASDDLLVTPTKFTLNSAESKIVNIHIKSDVNYEDKNYILYITTDDNPLIVGQNKFEVPIIVSYNDEKQDDSLSIIDDSTIDSNYGLTKITIIVPVKAIIK